MKGIILAGGGGTRLFPMSRGDLPKQFLKMGSDESLLVQTVKRLMTLMPPNDIVVVTNARYIDTLNSVLRENLLEGCHVIYEPEPRNTAPAVLLAMKYCQDVLHAGLSEPMVVCPADHMIGDTQCFVDVVRIALDSAQNNVLATISIRPTHAETGYGYIKRKKDFGFGFEVERFVEKPNVENAQLYLESGEYFWNSGVYIFTTHCLLNELDQSEPQLLRWLMNKSYENVLDHFKDIPNISFDYAFAEKSKQMVSYYLNTEWSDIGSWDSVYDYFKKDAHNNVINGRVETFECQNSLFFSEKTVMVGVGVKNLICVESDNVILLMERGRSQDLKLMTNQLPKDSAILEKMKCYRPWGDYEILTNQEACKIKKIVVNAHQKLSYQMHNHRDEYWIIIKGSANIIIDDMARYVTAGEHLLIPKKAKHRIENDTDHVFELIELQTGEYLEEDDIVRFEDQYGRV